MVCSKYIKNMNNFLLIVAIAQLSSTYQTVESNSSIFEPLLKENWVCKSSIRTADIDYSFTLNLSFSNDKNSFYDHGKILASKVGGDTEKFEYFMEASYIASGNLFKVTSEKFEVLSRPEPSAFFTKDLVKQMAAPKLTNVSTVEVLNKNEFTTTSENGVLSLCTKKALSQALLL